MLCARKFMRTKYVLTVVTVYCLSWLASVNEWHAGVRWSGHREGGRLSTMRTIVAYSEGKQAEMDRPSPITCDRLPAYPEVPRNSRNWSPNEDKEFVWQRVAGTRVSLYGAYYDERTPQPYVRILATFEGRNFSSDQQLFCQTLTLNPYDYSVEVVAAKPLEIWWHEWDSMSYTVETPLLLSCPLTEPLNRASLVSVVTQPCEDPANAFYLEPSATIKNKRNFTICVKDMNFNNDISQTLVEWIETNRILGVDKIDMYIDKLVKKSENVLQHYRDKGYVRLFNVPIKYKPERSLWQRRRDHIITYNDCLYRNLRESEFVIPLDIDEIILPKIADTLQELIERLKVIGWNPSQDSAIMVRNVFFFGFMQGLDKYNHRNVLTKSKMYVKRDNVRIKTEDKIGIGEIELVENTDSNEVIDYKTFKNKEEKMRKKYEFRCKEELPLPKLVTNVVSSAMVSPVGYYTKSLMVTRKVLTAFNHYPLSSLGTSGFARWSAPYDEVQLNHYKESCNTTMMVECAGYGRRARIDRAAMRLRTKLIAALAGAICTSNATINTT